jgi:hypothetical protein
VPLSINLFSAAIALIPSMTGSLQNEKLLRKVFIKDYFRSKNK